MQKIFFIIIGFILANTAMAQEEFSITIKGCSSQSYKLGVDEIHLEDKNRDVGEFFSPCNNGPLSYMTRDEIKFKEVIRSIDDVLKLRCNLEVSTTYYCTRMQW